MLLRAVAAQASVSIAQFGLPAIGPELQDEYGLGLAGLGAVLTASLLGSGLTLLPGGVVVDRYGSRLPLAIGTAFGAGGLAVAAFAPSTAVLLVSLLVAGVGSGFVPIAGFGALMRAYDATRRGFALGIRQMAVPVGGLIAAVLLPLLARAGGVGWRSSSALRWCSCSGRDSPSSRRQGRRPIGGRGSRCTGSSGRRACCACSSWRPSTSSFSSRFSRSPCPPCGTPGFSALVAGASFFALNATAAVARIVWGRIADLEAGSRRVRTLVEAGLVGAVGGVVFTLALHGGPAALVVAMILFAFGALGWNALVYVSAGEKAPPELAAQAVGIAATLIFVVSAVSTPPMGALAAAVGWDWFWLACAGLLGIGAAVALTLPPGVRAPAPE